MLKIYTYDKCDSCRKALKFLTARGLSFENIQIVETPPSLAELNKMLNYLKAQGDTFKNLFNTSGVLYREMNIAQKIKEGMTEDQALQLLSKNGKLIKRPFLLGSTFGHLGFKEDEWRDL